MNSEFRKRYAQGLAILQAERSGVPLPPTPESIPEADQPLPSVVRALPWTWQKSISAGKTRLYIPVEGNRLAIVRECGKPLHIANHILELYAIADMKDCIDNQCKPSTLITRAFTPPFMFHDEGAARKAIRLALENL